MWNLGGIGGDTGQVGGGRRQKRHCTRDRVMLPLAASFGETRVVAYVILGPILLLAVVAFLFWLGKGNQEEPPEDNSHSDES
jgi:hypothetical protein